MTTLGQTPPRQAHHDACLRYEEATAGIPDCFDYMTAEAIREIAAYAVTLDPNTTVDTEADKFIRGHLDMLSAWRDALDALDSELRADVADGSLPDWASNYLKTEARELFRAASDLQSAVTEYHHGSTGPRLDSEYGFAFVLSNSALSPF